MMDQQAAIRAQANIDDGWPYPDDNSDMREETHYDDDDTPLLADCIGAPCGVGASDNTDVYSCENPLHSLYGGENFTDPRDRD